MESTVISRDVPTSDLVTSLNPTDKSAHFREKSRYNRLELHCAVRVTENKLDARGRRCRTTRAVSGGRNLLMFRIELEYCKATLPNARTHWGCNFGAIRPRGTCREKVPVG
jgi:hypothetical protein